jgi:hypothetical protein
MKKYILLLCATTILYSFSHAQSDLTQMIRDAAPQNFFEKQKVINDYYAANPTATGYKQWKRKEWFVEPRVYPTGESMNITSRNIKAYQKLQKTQPQQNNDRSTHGGWFFLGPNDWVAGFGGNGGQGRVNCIEIHPYNEDIIYVGASNGGIWKTTDGGSNWTNVTPNLSILSIADIEIDPNNPNRIFCSTRRWGSTTS